MNQTATALRQMRHGNTQLLDLQIEGEDMTDFRDSLTVANYWIDRMLEKVHNESEGAKPV